MKKLVLILSVITIVMGTAVATFAKPSAEVKGVVQVKNAYGSNGKAVQIVVEQISSEQQKLVNNVLKAGNLKKLLKNSYSENYQVVDMFDAYVLDGKKGKLDYEKASDIFPVTITFSVPGVKPGSKVQVLHYYDGAWHVNGDVTVGNGEVTGTFEHLSPFIFLVDKNTVDTVATPSQSIVSPKTGNTDIFWYEIVFVAAFAVCSSVVIKRKFV